MGEELENSISEEQPEPNALTAPPPIVADTGDEADETRRLPFNVVAIGASAGGVEAYMELFDHLPATTGMAYVVIPHLSADQKSHMGEILARHSDMRVLEIEDGMHVEPDRVYVVPPNALLSLEGGEFHLDSSDLAEAQRAIDHFLYSLAAFQKNRAIGVILSGMDSDGALGLRAIKGEGGITMVQLPETAQFPEMPRASISADHVDLILSPSQIATQLTQLARQFRETNLNLLQDGIPIGDQEQQFLRILSLLRGVSGVDFRVYKPNTIRRRIARRMLLHRIDTLRDYVTYLQSNPVEVRELQEDALINVTRFFRDSEVFDAFKTLVLPRIFEDRDASQVRIWVAGCATGEEVYSFAICLLEFLLTKGSIEPPIQIFGTDASESNIQKARVGIYSETIVADVSQERLRRFFIKTEKGYQVVKRVRDLCIFARQNLSSDPPFSRMDVISCRNVLIYFSADLQRQLIPTFHYSLRQDGFLILGTSETIREFTDLFSLVDRKHKIYSRTSANATRNLLDIDSRNTFADFSLQAPPPPQPEPWGDVELQRAADRILLSRYAPPGVVVNERMEILQSRGRISPFLELRPGAATLDLLHMTRETIAPQVSAAVRRAINEDIPVQVEGMRVDDGQGSREAMLEVLPIHSLTNRARCYLVVFVGSKYQSEGGRVETVPSLAASPEEKDRMIAQLQHDIASTKLYLQSLVEERDAKNQELVSANEEIQSANEELQSTNEELETTKEELQSSNEELHTVNDELQNRNVVLTQASNDLVNLLNSVNLPVIMLSNELSIRQFTPTTQNVMNLRASDVGRPLGELRVNLQIDDLTPLLREVLETLTAREIEVQDRDGHWYLLRVRPYRTTDNKIEGLVVALVDIDQLRRSQQELRSARDFSRSIIQGVPLPIAVVDREFTIRATNPAFCEVTRSSIADLERRSLLALTSRLWGLDSELRANLETLRNASTVGENFEFEHTTADPRPKTFCIRGCLLQPNSEQFLLVTIEDITSHKDAERMLTSEKERLASEVQAKTQSLARSEDELRALTGSLFNSQEEERRRIARELHDDVSQRLAALAMMADQMDIATSSNATGVKEGLQRMREGISQLSEDVRSMSHRLHPSTLENLGLKVALKSLTEEFAEREKMIATFSSRNVPEDIPVEIATVLYRIAQETFRNISKHAGQTHVRVALTGTQKGIQLQVSDFGHGFEMDQRGSGLGLLSMEERARQIGGAFQVQSALGEGTRITVRVPLTLAQAEPSDAS